MSVSLPSLTLVGRKYFLLFYTEIQYINLIALYLLTSFKMLKISIGQKITNEKPYAVFFMGDLNAESLSWWSEGVTTDEGTQLDDLFSKLNLTQIISEPTHFYENCPFLHRFICY